MGPYLQVLGLRLQVQCVWKPIWALYSLKYLWFFLFCFFFTTWAVPEKGSRVISEVRGGELSNTRVSMTLPQSHPPLRPSPRTYSSFVSLVIFTYKFTFFCILQCKCFWFVLNSMELTRWCRSWSPGRTDTWCLCGLSGLGSLTCWCSLGFCLVCFEENVGSKLVFWNYFG